MKFSVILLASAATALPHFGFGPSFGGFKTRACDLSNAQLPAPASGYGSTFTAPAGLKLSTVVLGTGTQNYTCASSTAAPVPNGAKADIYDASCLAAYFPAFLHYLPGFILNNPKQVSSILNTFTLAKAGDHIFPDATTAVFNFVPTENEKFVGKKKENVAAPADAPSGQYGAVDWLNLEWKEGTLGGFKNVYRVVTAGGKAPTTCEGRQKQFEMKYATEYWFYK